ncbi:MAG TPA: hypothetical protein VGX91_01285 [Candidatus Cybelea sp.]|nr:hypothetical protein [Candidatus Cybelea sp.]
MSCKRHVLGIAAAAALLAGCSAPGPALTGASPARLGPDSRSQEYIYVANEIGSHSNWHSAVDIFPIDSSGDAPPSEIITGAQTHLTQVNGIVVTPGGEIYVADTDTNEIVGFPVSASGNSSPNVIIHGARTQLSWPIGLALDASGDLFVAECASDCTYGSMRPAVLEFARGANGNTYPVREITGPRTGLSHANAIALDSKGNIYVSNIGGGSGGNSIDVFVPDAFGNARPSRVIEGSRTRLDGPLGIAVDRYGLYADSDYDSYVVRFKENARGDVSPLATIAGSKTDLSGPDGMAIDSSGAVFSTSRQRILKFLPLANGNARPSDKIEGSLTQLVSPTFLYVQ